MFQSTPPEWGATYIHYFQFCALWFQSTPPEWGATSHQRYLYQEDRVSIHAPRVGSDRQLRLLRQRAFGFNPRPPSGERPFTCPNTNASCCFNPRPPSGERLKTVSVYKQNTGFNPRPPSGERLKVVTYDAVYGKFQSTPPEWGATTATQSQLKFYQFQSTPPEWGATRQDIRIQVLSHVSIHAPRVGSDNASVKLVKYDTCFNPRPPSGERHASTAALWLSLAVSIHAPRVGSDPQTYIKIA